jgi:hypothetical protein
MLIPSSNIGELSYLKLDYIDQNLLTLINLRYVLKLI